MSQSRQLALVAGFAALAVGCPLGIDFDGLDRPTDSADSGAADVVVADDTSDAVDADISEPDTATNDTATTDIATTDIATTDIATTDTDTNDTATNDTADADPADGATADVAADAAIDIDEDTADTTTDADIDTATDAGPESSCGNGEPDPGEACDDGDENADRADTCRTNCMVPRCGDGIVDSLEQCDDGNLIPDDGCEDTCVWSELGACQHCTTDDECAPGLACIAGYDGGRCMQPCRSAETVEDDCPYGGEGLACSTIRGRAGSWCVPRTSCDTWCVDNDRDGFSVGTGDCGPIDCDDSDDEAAPGRTDFCRVGLDGDCDGFSWCDDRDCEGRFVCGLSREQCRDGRDNDGDEAIDCADIDCAGHEACVVPTCFAPATLPLGYRFLVPFTCRAPDRIAPIASENCTVGGDPAGEAVYLFETDVPGRLTVDVRDFDLTAAIDARVFARTGACDDPTTQAACSAEVPCAESDIEVGECILGAQPRHARIEVAVEAGQTWIVVEAFENTRARRDFQCGRVTVEASFEATE